MEPQLRRPGGSGTGTPFNAFNPFAADDAAGEAGEAGEAKASKTAQDPVEEAPDKAENTRPAAFNKGSRRGRRRTDSPAG
jgi:hypothetical protein